MIRLFIVFLSLTLFFEINYAQEEILPRFLTEEEKELWPEYLRNLEVEGEREVLPEVPVRVMGEWEEIQALFLTWRSFPAILTEIVRHAVQEVKVYIITSNANSVRNTLINAGISLDSIFFLDYPSNSIWIRDYGPWAVYENDVEQLAIADFVYNRPRANDNNIPSRIAEAFGLPLYGATAEPNRWVHTGGNNLVDGYKTGYSSNLLFAENPGKSEADLDRIGNALFGYEEYVKFEELPYDGISHLDMHMRFIDEETVIIGEYPNGVSDGPQIEENIKKLLEDHKTAFGNDYTVKRIPMPPGSDGRYPWQGGPYRTYTNSIFLNKTLLVPIYEEQYDTIGLRIYRENLPGYKVVGINCNGMISSLGALHCITKTIGVENPLWIAHPRVKDQQEENLSAQAKAIIKHRHGIAEATLYYKTSQDSFYQSVPMTVDSLESDVYQAWIPGQSFGSEVHYYIEALSNSGKKQVRPITAPEGFFRFKVEKSWEAPTADGEWEVIRDCQGTTVFFENKSLGEDLDFLWTFEGGVPSSSTDKNPVVFYPESGSFEVTLIASNPGGKDTLRAVEAVFVAAAETDFVETFEAEDLNNWIQMGPKGDLNVWELYTQTGCYNQRALFVDNFQRDSSFWGQYLLSRWLEIKGQEDPAIFFSFSYPSSTGQEGERLELIATDCEGQRFVLYAAENASLATTDFGMNASFFPDKCEDWAHEVISLKALDAEKGPYRLDFVFHALGINNFFLDNLIAKDLSLGNAMPEVAFIRPSRDTSLEAASLPLSLEVELEAFDRDGFLDHVTLKMGEGPDDLFARSVAPFVFVLPFEQSGEYLLEASAKDNEGGVSIPIFVIVDVRGAVSLDRYLDLKEIPISVFPNPVDKVLYLLWKGGERFPDFSIAIWDAKGRKVSDNIRSEELIMGWNCSHLAPGYYQITFEDKSGKMYPIKFIVK